MARAIFLTAVLVLHGCASPAASYSRDGATVHPGMTPEQVIEAWGPPDETGAFADGIMSLGIIRETWRYEGEPDFLVRFGSNRRVRVIQERGADPKSAGEVLNDGDGKQ